MSERIRYGDETREELSDGTPLYIPRDSEQCHDCQVERGENHLRGCDVEQCPECGRQLIGCGHEAKHLRDDIPDEIQGMTAEDILKELSD